MCFKIIYIWYMYKLDLALNNQQALICHKPKTKSNPFCYIAVTYIFSLTQTDSTNYGAINGLVWFGFFVSWHINLCRLFNAKSILLEQ